MPAVDVPIESLRTAKLTLHSRGYGILHNFARCRIRQNQAVVAIYRTLYPTRPCKGFFRTEEHGFYSLEGSAPLISLSLFILNHKSMFEFNTNLMFEYI